MSSDFDLGCGGPATSDIVHFTHRDPRIAAPSLPMGPNGARPCHLHTEDQGSIVGSSAQADTGQGQIDPVAPTRFSCSVCANPSDRPTARSHLKRWMGMSLRSLSPHSVNPRSDGRNSIRSFEFIKRQLVRRCRAPGKNLPAIRCAGAGILDLANQENAPPTFDTKAIAAK
jgi:hypothetical protein